ncbi:cobaltochelatase CobT-related protein [Bosea beijingensis]|uniref:cobaltochelatase CobT-related protein n=1 Tax=Bosea beijingensis TaxID=3068632 RepID=UPI0027403BA5|nr:hypothetical protein [Bosea sp. REN20]
MRWRSMLQRMGGWLSQPPAHVPNLPAPDEYRVFTKAHDREIRLEDLDAALGPMDVAQHREFEASKQACSIGLKEWQAEANIRALLWRNQLAEIISDVDRRNAAVCILLDLSGSMRGQKMMMVVGALGVFGVVPQAFGMQCEILGFTTLGWRGGRSREDWVKAGKPRWPGRLNDLLHLVVADADVRDSARLANFSLLLRPDLLKENIDGEAVEWACSRLMARQVERRALIVISDGAPVDDATLSANEPDILSDHLQEIMEIVRERSEIEVFGIGIDYSPAQYYPTSQVAATPDELLDALFRTLLNFLKSKRPKEGNAPLVDQLDEDGEQSSKPAKILRET